jgi:4-amino-4-deoxy-L-arabinose transferase-like glycosyltransferase
VFRSWALLLALTPHLLVAAYYGNRLIPYPDQDCYLDSTKNLLAGRGIQVSFDALAGFVKKGEPTSYYGVGTQFLLAPTMWLFGENYFFLRLGNIILFALTLFFFRHISLLWLPAALADLATLALGMSPFYIAFNQLFLTEMPFLCFELGTFFFLFRYLRNNGQTDLVWSAVFLGLSLLVRSNLLAFLPVILIAIRSARSTWRAAVVYAFMTGIVIAPYCFRNSFNNGAFFPFDGKAALNLWQFNSDVHQGTFFGESFLQAPDMPSFGAMTEKERADQLMAAGTEWIKNHPWQFVRLSLMRGMRFLSPFPHMAENKKLTLLLLPYSVLLIGGFFLGLTALSWRDREHVLVVLLFLYTLAIDMVFMSATRHRILFDPFFLLVGFYWFSKSRFVQRRESGQVTTFPEQVAS